MTQKSGPIAWMAGNSVAANLIVLVCLLGGLIMVSNIKQEVFPDFALDQVRVTVPYPGSSPEEVEEGVILPVEEAVRDLEGIKEMQSTASENMGTILFEAEEGTDVNRLWQDVESEVNRIDTFPDEAEDPQVAIASHQRSVLTLAVFGVQDDLMLREAAEMVREELLQHQEITQVSLQGARDLEIQIEISQAMLRRYDLSLDEVANAVARASVDLGGGSLKTTSGDILVRVRDKRDTAEEYARVPILTRENGSRILLGDLGTVRQGLEETDAWSQVNGWPAVSIEVSRVGSQTPVQVARAAREVVAELNAKLPGNLQVEVLRDRSKIYKQRADLLLRNAYIGLGLVFLLLALFLEARLAFWVSLGIPISFMGSFLLLAGTDFSLNMITMFAFIVTLGIVVDDAIVVGENVFHHRRQGLSGVEASVLGAREVALPVVFSVLTNMVAFLPLFFIPGVMGKIFQSIPLVVVCVFFISLVESLFVLPAHLGHVGPRRSSGLLGALGRLQESFSNAVEKVISKGFGPFLGLVLKNRYLALILGLALLLAAFGFVKSGRMGMVLFPSVESDYAFAQAVLPAGAATREIQEAESRLLRSARAVIERHGGEKLASSILSQVNKETIQIRIFLTDPKIRPLGTAAVSEAWRMETGTIPGLESLSFESSRGGPGAGKALTVQLSYRDKDLLEQAGRELAAELEHFSGVFDIDDGSARGKQQFDIHLSPLGERLGLSSRVVANQIRHFFYGAEAVKQLKGRNEITVRVRLPESERNTLRTLDEIVLRTPKGEVSLQQAAGLEPGRAFTAIQRRNGRRVISVTANVQPRSQTEQLVADLKQTALPELQASYPGLTFSFEGHQADIRESVSSLIKGLALALIGLYGLLAIPFKSYAQPMIIMVCIPFGMIGAVIGHLIMGYTLSVMSLFGIVALSGVVINDSLILIHFTNRLRLQGASVFEAAQQAGKQRFRPILLTTLTTFGGLSPMIMETSRQARFLIPMAISLGFGLVFATFIILLLVPCLYLVLEDAGLMVKKIR